MTEDVLSASPAELEEILAAAGQPHYRGRQLFRALWHDGVPDYGAVTVWPKPLRTLMAERLPWRRVRAVREQRAPDGTVKWLLEYADGGRVETVLLPHDYGYSLCVSTQVGCAMGCAFCASGLSGRMRNLTAGEMLEQVRYADTYLAAADPGARVSRVDLMGSGEPLDNYRAVVRFLALAHEPEGLNLGYRNLTVSTSGLPPRMRQLAEEGMPVTLAVSLHAPDDELRSRLMPVNRAYPVAAVVEAAACYWRRTRRRVTFEYLLLRDVNDRPEQAQRLVALLRPLGAGAHVNLIPWNPVPELPWQASGRRAADRFLSLVQGGGVSCTIRKEFGQEIDAACGQLRRREEGMHDSEGLRLVPPRPGAG